MLRSFLCFTLIILISTSCNKATPVTNKEIPCPEISYFDLDCIIDFQEDDIIGANGFHTFLYNNGNIKSEGNLTNGIPNGFWKFFYDNGHLKTEGNYSNGQLNGFWKVYWYNGNIREEGHYQYCEKQGYWKFFYPSNNQQLKHEGNFHQGKRVNTWKSYDETGLLISIITCFD